MKKRILFVTQDLNRTGSEMLLWYLLINFDKEKYKAAVFCMRKGQLYDLLPNHIEKSIMYKSSPKWIDRTWRRILKIFGRDPFAFQLEKIQKGFQADIWYVNTIAIPDAFSIGKQLGVKIVTHIHELLNAFSLISAESMNRIISDSEICIGCSDVVCDTICALGHQDVRLQYSFVDTETILVDRDRIIEIKNELGISATDFVWVISGGALYMKGLDYVLAILEHFKDEDVKIIWIGARFDNGLDYYIEHVASKKYPGKLFFTGVLSRDYYNYMSIAKGVLLLSREESFSLVLIEAAYLGIPVVAFNVGIAKKFLTPDIGAVVDNGDIENFVKAMRRFYENPTLWDPVLLKEKAKEYSLKVQLPRFEALLSEL